MPFLQTHWLIYDKQTAPPGGAKTKWGEGREGERSITEAEEGGSNGQTNRGRGCCQGRDTRRECVYSTSLE